MENVVFTDLVGQMAYALGSIFGLVEFLKSALSLEGKAVTVMSFFVGIVAGSAIFAQYLLPEIGVYVSGAYFILSSGLVASGYYKFAAARWPKEE